MNEEAVRDKLAAAVPHADWCHEADRHPDFPCACDGYRSEIAAALLPVVREIAAEELREAARDLDDGEFSDSVSVLAARAVYNRADALKSTS